MPSFFQPDTSRTQTFLQLQTAYDFNYPAVGSTREAKAPAAYDHDFNWVKLGEGDAVWVAAKNAIRQWQMFPGGWAYIRPEAAPIRAGEVVAMTIRVMGFWWLNACRIVYVLDDDRQFGFAYGTLPGHAERGEELFMVERLEDGTVRYCIRAFSRPRHWMARLAYPLARAYQRTFVRASKASMLRYVAGQTRESGR